MSANLQLYEQEVISFLQSVTIVFSPMATLINNNLLAQGIEVNQSTPDTWKYFLNLSGQYYPNVDTMMTILSLDTKQTINYTTANLAISPKTAAAYVVGSPYYTALCQAYPTQTDLIKSIRYPVDLQTAINAPDFTLLGWGDGILEANEQDVILYELNTFISYVATRWYFSWLSYEAYYIWAFWSSLWQSLPNAIFAARLKYLHTSSVHSFHIWSYLQSHGIGDYSDILTSQQALFLYRNLNYLIQNKGKQLTLVILVNKLLDSLNVGLVGKTVYMNTATNAALCAWTPEFVSTVIPTNNAQSLELVAPESMTTLNAELVAAGLDNNSTIPYVAAQQTRIGLTPLNILPTKVVEIQKLGVDQKYGSLLNNFILDTLVWSITTGLYVPNVIVTDPTTNITLELSGSDALALYYYAVHRSCHEQPITLPNIYSPTCAFRPNITAASFPEQYTHATYKEGYSYSEVPASVVKDITYYLTNNYPTARSVTPTPTNIINFTNTVTPSVAYSYPTQFYLSITMMLEGLGYPVGTIADSEEFATMVANLFLVLIRYVRYSRTEGNKIALDMFLKYCETIVLQTTPYTVTLNTESNYATWAASPTVQASALILELDAQTDYVDAYISLTTAIMTQLLPEDNPIFTFFAYTTTSTDNLYDRLRSLFVQLCSYNICFLDTNRTNAWWFLNDRVVYEVQGQIDTQSLSVIVTENSPSINQTDVMSIPGIILSSEINIGDTDVVPIKISENDTISISNSDTRSIDTVVTVATQIPTSTDITYIPFQIGMGANVKSTILVFGAPLLSNQGTSSSTTQSASIDITANAGDVIILTVAIYSFYYGAAVPSITGGGLTWILIKGELGSGTSDTNNYVGMYYAIAPTSLTAVGVTVDWSGTTLGSVITLGYAAFACGTSTPIDSDVSLPVYSSADSSSAMALTNSLTTTNPSDVYLTLFVSGGLVSTGISTIEPSGSTTIYTSADTGSLGGLTSSLIISPYYIAPTSDVSVGVITNSGASFAVVITAAITTA